MEIKATSETTPVAARHRSVRTFVRHYVEMVIAMIAGMVVLGGAGVGLLALVGADAANWDGEVELSLLGMAFTMTVPMVAWMRHRGHGWAPSGEMAAAMFVPTFAAIGLLWAGIVEDADALMAMEHVAMFGLMLVVMLLRFDEYASPHPE